MPTKQRFGPDFKSHEGVEPHYHCECGAVSTPRMTNEEHEAHNNLGNPHWFYPEPNGRRAHVECPGCEQDGCDLSDCVYTVQEGWGCPLCGNEAARVVTCPPDACLYGFDDCGTGCIGGDCNGSSNAPS